MILWQMYFGEARFGLSGAQAVIMPIMDEHHLQLSNPYNPHAPMLPSGSLTAFAGRSAAYARLYHSITDSARAHAVAYLGDAGSGKTALLLNVGRVFPEQVIPIYVSLHDRQIAHEADFLRLLVAAIHAALHDLGFNLTRLSPIPEEDAALRTWLQQTGLPEIAALIRVARHVVLLLDDAEPLSEALVNREIAKDFLAYLHSLIQHPQLSLTFTFEMRTDLSVYVPLIAPSSTVRLDRLTEAEVAALLRDPVVEHYTVGDDAVSAVLQAAGGRPILVQAFGEAFFATWRAQQRQMRFTAADVAQLTTQVMARCEAYLRMLWRDQMSDRERIVATAIIGVKFDDPLLKVILAEQVVGWLVKTDYPLDVTAVNAAFRALEYADIVAIQQGGIQFTAGIIERWLLENARLTEPLLPNMLLRLQGARMRIWVLGLMFVVVALVLIWALSTTPLAAPQVSPQPTVTLVNVP